MGTHQLVFGFSIVCHREIADFFGHTPTHQNLIGNAKVENIVVVALIVVFLCNSKKYHARQSNWRDVTFFVTTLSMHGGSALTKKFMNNISNLGIK